MALDNQQDTGGGDGTLVEVEEEEEEEEEVGVMDTGTVTWHTGGQTDR